MGFDINITSDSVIIDTEYVSYNWGNLSEVCLLHARCNCRVQHLWYARDDMLFRSASDVAARCDRALEMMSRAGIIPTTHDETIHPDWTYGVATGREFTRLERLGIFAWILSRVKYKASMVPSDAIYDCSD